MGDREFFATLLEAFKKTTNAETAYWEPKKYDDSWVIYAVGKDSRELVAYCLTEEDADFVAGLHGALPDLVRRLNQAVEESDAADLRADEAQHRIAELEAEVARWTQKR